MEISVFRQIEHLTSGYHQDPQTVINEAVKVGSYTPEPVDEEGSIKGEVTINIVGPDKPVGATGQVTLKIIDIK